jgi:nucleoside-diphosphate-sugar epimerase
VFSALKDVKFVLHTASPYPGLTSADESTITTAVSGVLNVLKAAAETPTVERVILTSSGLAVLGVLTLTVSFQLPRQLLADVDKLFTQPDYVFTEVD